MVSININGIKKSFGNNPAVDISEFCINRGDLLGLVGNNGAGKTTLFRLILDLLKADEGDITMETTPKTATSDGNTKASQQTVTINPAHSEEWKTMTGAYIDEGFLIDFLTPEEYFYFIGKVNGMTKESVDERLKDFELFMSGEILGHKKLIRNLSAGNKQKVGIISTLLNKPELIILDEPFNFLDPSSQNALKKLLTDYNWESDATILISSHNLQHTVEISTRIALLEQGRIIKDIPNHNGCAEKELEDYFQI